MTLAPIVFWLTLWASFAATAAWATWRDRDLRWIGLWLVGGYLISNAVWLTEFVGIFGPEFRPGPYTFVEMMIGFAAYSAWEHHRYRGLCAIVGVAMLSICANVALAAVSPAGQRQIYAHTVTTNICFAIECTLATWVGIADAFATGHFHWLAHFSWRPRFLGRAIQSNAERAAGDGA